MNTLMHRSVCVIVPAPHEKGEVGMWKSEGTRQEAAAPHRFAAFLFVPQFWRPEWGGASLAGHAPRSPVFHTRSGCRPMWKLVGICPSGTTGASNMFTKHELEQIRERLSYDRAAKKAKGALQ